MTLIGVSQDALESRWKNGNQSESADIDHKVGFEPIRVDSSSIWLLNERSRGERGGTVRERKRELPGEIRERDGAGRERSGGDQK